MAATMWDSDWCTGGGSSATSHKLVVVGNRGAHRSRGLRLVTLTTRHLKRGDKIRLTGLGILQVCKRAARMGRNPATGEAIKIKASKKIAFRLAKELKVAVQGRAPSPLP
jgi:nucleoid DNA-binding protein